MPSTKILFIAESVSLSHLVRPLVLAQSLDSADYELHFASSTFPEFIFREANFIKHSIYSIPSDECLRRTTNGEVLYTEEVLSRYIKEEIQIIEELEPDLVVADFRLSAAVSTVKTETPYACITNAHWSPYAKEKDLILPDLPFTKRINFKLGTKVFNTFQKPLLKKHIMPLNKLRKDYGLDEFKTFREAFTYADHAFFAEPKGFIETVGLPESDIFLGPILWSAEVERSEEFEKFISGEEEVVYLTLGSTGNLELLPMILEALGSFDCKIVVTTGSRETPQIDSPSNVFITDYLPAADISKLARLVICNGGSPAAYQALAVGTPVLGICSNIDQFATMKNIEGKGAGRMLRASSLTIDLLREVVSELLTNQSYTLKTKELVQSFSLESAKNNFKDFLRTKVYLNR